MKPRTVGQTPNTAKSASAGAMNRYPDRSPHASPRTERRARLHRGVLPAGFDRFGRLFAECLSCDHQREVDACGHAAAGDDIAVDDDALCHRRCPECGEHLAAHPVGGGALSLKETGRA